MAEIAVVLGQDFEDSEFTIPVARLRETGHGVTVLGRQRGEELEGKRGEQKVDVDVDAGGEDPGDYDALLVPGGYSPDHLRVVPEVVTFVRAFVASGKPVAVICHGPQLLIEADAVQGRRLTSWPSVRKDLENAGAEWVDRQVVRDGNLITSRKPDDLEAFTAAFLEAIEEATRQPARG